MDTYLPYIVSVLCAAISGFASYIVARKQCKTDVKKLEKQYELDIEKEREKFAMEKEKMELDFKYKLELQQKEMENQIGADLVSTVVREYLNSPSGKSQLKNVNDKNANSIRH